MLQDGFVTFGSFNNLAKVSRTLVGHWAAILTAVPYSRLLLKSKGLSANGSREHMRQQFRDHGIDAERIELVGWTSDRIDHMNLYRKVDIALDTFPYNGTTTTCEALWMGVPVMTLAGLVHVSRVGASLLHAVGLAEMAIQGVILGLLMAWYRFAPGWQIALVPVWVLMCVVTALAFGLWLTALNVKYRDVGMAVPFLLQAWMYLCPVIYPSSVIPEKWRILYGLNPMVGVIEGFRWSILGMAAPDWGMISVSFAVVTAIFVGGLYYFRTVEATFADVI